MRLIILFRFLLGLCLIVTIRPSIGQAWFEPRVAVKPVQIPVAPDVELVGRLYQAGSEPGVKPAILMICPWSVGIWVYDQQARKLAEEGFVVLAYNTRGWGGSDGLVDGGGPVDQEDARRVIDWLATQAAIDSERIGMAGISLGAGTSLMVAAVDPRVKAVVALSGWSDLYVSVFGHNTRRTLWDRILQLGAAALGGRFPQGYFEEQNAALAQRDPIKIRERTDPRSPIRLIDRYRQHQTAIFISHNYSDFLFPVSETWRFYQELQAPKKLRLQPGIHASAEVLEIFFNPDGPIWSETRSWFRQWLFGERDASFTGEELHVEIPERDESWHFTAEEPLRTETVRLHLSEEGRDRFGSLVKQPLAKIETRTIKADEYSGVSAGLPLIYPLIDSFEPRSNQMKSRRIRTERAAVYQLARVDEPLLLAGIPRLQLKLTSNRQHAMIVAYLFNVSKSDEWRPISVAPYTVPDARGGVELNFELFSGFAVIEPGDRLVLAIDTYELEFAPSENLDYQVILETGGASWIDLPVLIKP